MLEHIDCLVQDCTISIVNAPRYSSFALDHLYVAAYELTTRKIIFDSILNLICKQEEYGLDL